jgi:hypothetical protein
MLALRVNVEIDGVFAQGRNGALSAVPAALSLNPIPIRPVGKACAAFAIAPESSLSFGICGLVRIDTGKTRGFMSFSENGPVVHEEMP